MTLGRPLTRIELLNQLNEEWYATDEPSASAPLPPPPVRPPPTGEVAEEEVALQHDRRVGEAGSLEGLAEPLLIRMMVR